MQVWNLSDCFDRIDEFHIKSIFFFKYNEPLNTKHTFELVFYINASEVLITKQTILI
jgi:hypothetical protein